MLRDLRKLGISKVVIDARGMTGNPSITDRFELGELLAKQAGARVAVAIVDSALRVLPDRFLETVAVSRGACVKVTTDVAEALAWIDAPQRGASLRR